MRVAYLQCVGGISGDMTLAALLDAGADPDALVEGLRTLALPPWELRVDRTLRRGIAAAAVEVLVRGRAAGAAPLLREPPADAPAGEAPPPSTHAHAHLHSGEQGHAHSHGEPGHAHAHSGEQGHAHAHSRSSGSQASGGPGTRTFAEVAALIEGSALPESVRRDATAVYRRLAAAEAAVHGSTLEAVHFHEVGAVDSIVDVVGAVFALHLLGVERVVCSPLPQGHGFVRCAHGLMPVPAPATAELLKGCPLRPVDVEGELVTPTGAALAAGLAEGFGPVPEMILRAIGYGAGRRDFPFPNVVRVLIGDDDTAPAEAGNVAVIEANIDDQSPELYETALDALFRAGALDAWVTPIHMKKNRPAHLLSVLCEPARREALTEILFAETTTLGVRFSQWQRACLAREWLEVPTRYGAVRVKVGRRHGEVRTASPEYEQCRRAAAAAGVPVKLVYAAAAAAAWERLGSGEVAPGAAGSEEPNERSSD